MTAFRYINHLWIINRNSCFVVIIGIFAEAATGLKRTGNCVVSQLLS